MNLDKNYFFKRIIGNKEKHYVTKILFLELC